MAKKGKKGKSKIDPNSRIISIYTLNGIKDKSAVKIKHLETGRLEMGQRIKDTSIHKYDINSFIGGEIYACNITDASLISSKKQPMLYVTIAMVKPLKAAVLCNIILYFTIEDDVQTKEQFLTKTLNGKFTLEIFLQGESKQLDQEIDVFPGNNKIIEMMESLTKNDTMVEVLKELADIEEAKIAKKYAGELEYFSMPTKTISLKNYKTNNRYDNLSDSSDDSDEVSIEQEVVEV